MRHNDKSVMASSPIERDTAADDSGFVPDHNGSSKSQHGRSRQSSHPVNRGNDTLCIFLML